MMDLFEWADQRCNVVAMPVAHWGRKAWMPVAEAVIRMLSDPANDHRAHILWDGLDRQCYLELNRLGATQEEIEVETRKARQFVMLALCRSKIAN